MFADSEFEKLVNLYYRELYRFGLSLTGNEADACDLTQETFYTWATKGHQVKNPEKVKTWLFTTLHRQFLQICRRRGRFAHEALDETAENLPCLSIDMVNRIDGQTMINLLGQVDVIYRAPLVLYYLEDLSYQEIAQALEIPLGTVQSRIARGKMRLFRLLTEVSKPLGQNE
jgi:RNA polymerase sigma-70 factor (ECF subfamily)